MSNIKKRKLNVKLADETLRNHMGFNAYNVLTSNSADAYYKRVKGNILAGHPEQERLLKKVYELSEKAVKEHEAKQQAEEAKAPPAPASKQEESKTPAKNK